jgi:glycerate kinase
VVVAPDKFRGTLSARDAAAAIAGPLRAAGHDVVEVPMADGGEGTLDALGGPNRTTTVSGPLGDPVEAGWRLASRRAVIEMAQASGLALLDEVDAVAASTYGTGELIAAAVEAGATHVLVGLGGSATTDGGSGALRALYPTSQLRGVRIEVACDVTTPFTDAARVFAPQKGASPAQVAFLTRRLEALVDQYREQYGVDVSELEGAGAAGGLAGGLACVGAALVPGVELVGDALGLPDLIDEADVVVTGEGHLDAESFEGKVVGGVAELARASGVPCVAVVGDADPVETDLPVVSLVARFGRERALDDTAECLGEVAEELLDQAVGADGRVR